jgi:hypothetical protein
MLPDKLLFILSSTLGTILLLWAASAIVSRVFVRRYIGRLLHSIGRERLPNFTAALSEKLPVAIQRYLHYALKDGQPNIRYAVLEQRARFRHGANRPWMDVKAREYISGMEPGFVWDATLKHNRFWWRTAKLGYIAGEGHGHIKLFGALTLEEFDGPETNTSMLFRFLSELVWLPTGLLPTRTLRWESVDDNSARAIIVDGDVHVEAVFHVNSVGQVDRIVTDHKYRDTKSGYEPTTFTLACRNYAEVDGVMIPLEVDFVWNLPSGDLEYGQFRITDADFHFA